ncbi:hypothetical protein B0H13DRAFT_2661494 [Mycena leptocephala]|nr:hypothetical protein B0H13DRAFT_2661494 [Mycena leptocephala]
MVPQLSTAPARQFLDRPAALPSPDLIHLLRSNELPRESEIQTIRDIISEGQERLRPLDAQISTFKAQIRDLQVTLAQFVKRRGEIATHVHQHRGIVSPIRRLPLELICEILTLVHGDLWDVEKKPLWYLGHICRSWRHAALSCASLWSCIIIERPTVLAGIEAQLQRTAQVPLDIHFRDVQSNMGHVLELVFPHSNRWRSLYLNHHGPSNYLLTLDWLRPLEGHLGQLEKLEVAHFRIATPDIFLTAPRLREVILTEVGLHFTFSPTSIQIPWHQITHYRGYYRPERQLNTLRDAPGLVECAIGFRGQYSHFPIHPKLLHLRRLTLHTLQGVLQHLTAPVLEDLCIFTGRPAELPQVLPFIHRSSCTLHRLVLRHSMICPELTTLLRGLPSLAHLVLEEHSGTPLATDQLDLFTALSIPDPDSQICPNLTSLVFGYGFLAGAPADAFFAMARARFQPNSRSGSRVRLACLRLFVQDHGLPPDSMVAQIQALREDGFDAAFLDKQQIEY